MNLQGALDLSLLAGSIHSGLPGTSSLQSLVAVLLGEHLAKEDFKASLHSGWAESKLSDAQNNCGSGSEPFQRCLLNMLSLECRCI